MITVSLGIRYLPLFVLILSNLLRTVFEQTPSDLAITPNELLEDRYLLNNSGSVIKGFLECSKECLQIKHLYLCFDNRLPFFYFI